MLRDATVALNAEVGRAKISPIASDGELHEGRRRQSFRVVYGVP